MIPLSQLRSFEGLFGSKSLLYVHAQDDLDQEGKNTLKAWFDEFKQKQRRLELRTISYSQLLSLPDNSAKVSHELVVVETSLQKQQSGQLATIYDHLEKYCSQYVLFYCDSNSLDYPLEPHQIENLHDYPGTDLYGLSGLFWQDPRYIFREDINGILKASIPDSPTVNYLVFEKVLCPICQAHFGRTVCKDLMECSGCGLLRKQYLLTAPLLLAGLAKYTIDSCRSLEKKLEAERVAAGQFEALKKHAAPGKLFDVGAGGGFFLKAARERGWEASGNEVSDFAIAFVKQEYGIELVKGLIEDLKLPENHFDAVSLIHTLEHTLNPYVTIMACRNILKDGGLMQIGVPLRNFSNICVGYQHQHFYEFNRDTLLQLMAKCGFEVVEVNETGCGFYHVIDLTSRKAGLPAA